MGNFALIRSIYININRFERTKEKSAALFSIRLLVSMHPVNDLSMNNDFETFRNMNRTNMNTETNKQAKEYASDS